MPTFLSSATYAIMNMLHHMAQHKTSPVASPFFLSTHEFVNQHTRYRSRIIMARIVVAMSGGVDSSVAAALLKEQGHGSLVLCYASGQNQASLKMMALNELYKINAAP